jgi:oligopeptide/dipeptide ABC transporter ATP-binding protein
VPPLLDVRHLTVEFQSHRNGARHLEAVRDLSFSISPGEVLGLVGESGSGKSLTALSLMRLLPPQASCRGEIEFTSHGDPAVDLLKISGEKMRSLRGSLISMIFQEPMTSLNPVMRVGNQIAEAVMAHNGLGWQSARERAVLALNEVAIADAGRRSRDYPHQLSGGMRQRVMIAMAIVNRPQLLIADEPSTALDVTVQAQIIDLLMDLRERFGLAMLFISHDLALLSEVADRIAVMYAGTLVELGTKEQVYREPAHPYTRGLLKAAPSLKTDRRRPLITIEGTVPALQSLPKGCSFEPRCGYRIAACAREMPGLVEVSAGHWARCPVVNHA